jgi:hypothetical protein
VRNKKNLLAMRITWLNRDRPHLAAGGTDSKDPKVFQDGEKFGKRISLLPFPVTARKSRLRMGG